VWTSHLSCINQSIAEIGTPSFNLLLAHHYG
jgi:hypothetical protein